jgi:ABC-type lipoprotein export system ATPase subunit
MKEEILQVVNDVGQFQEGPVQAFVADRGIAAARTNYEVVAIMGPQSSGKSTLLNYVVRWRRRSDLAESRRTSERESGKPLRAASLPCFHHAPHHAASRLQL